MRATILHGAGDIRVEDVPDARVEQPSDVVVRVLQAGICGSDLHRYRRGADGAPESLGHEFIGIVEDVGAEVGRVKRGDLVVSPWAFSDGTCEFCRDGRFNNCKHGGSFSYAVPGAQAEAVRVPLADSTLVKLPVAADSALMPSLLTLTDSYPTGHHGAVRAGVTPRTTVTVIGDGSVGLSAVLAAKRLGAERIILMGRHKERTDLGREFGATDVVAERGPEGVAKVLELTGGDGTHRVIEAVGYRAALEQAMGVVRTGGVISSIGVPQYTDAPTGLPFYRRGLTLTGGSAPVRAFIEELMPDILDGTVQPGRVFDSAMPLDDVAEGYRAMSDREALKVRITP
jgi:threonine dehydrogenase-like Zn-dependent dehydrogenase